VRVSVLKGRYLFPHLFSPFNLGDTVLANRLVIAPMTPLYSDPKEGTRTFRALTMPAVLREASVLDALSFAR
jgi:2,4-dienoyl-CoA reductase-like NADH-dependent reductase (Old Yellow Enzyme family)